MTNEVICRGECTFAPNEFTKVNCVHMTYAHP